MTVIGEGKGGDLLDATNEMLRNEDSGNIMRGDYEWTWTYELDLVVPHKRIGNLGLQERKRLHSTSRPVELIIFGTSGSDIGDGDEARRG
jgi:hypothetical protein